MELGAASGGVNAAIHAVSPAFLHLCRAATNTPPPEGAACGKVEELGCLLVSGTGVRLGYSLLTELVVPVVSK